MNSASVCCLLLCTCSTRLFIGKCLIHKVDWWTIVNILTTPTNNLVNFDLRNYFNINAQHLWLYESASSPFTFVLVGLTSDLYASSEASSKPKIWWNSVKSEDEQRIIEMADGRKVSEVFLLKTESFQLARFISVFADRVPTLC